MKKQVDNPFGRNDALPALIKELRTRMEQEYLKQPGEHLDELELDWRHHMACQSSIINVNCKLVGESDE